MFAAPPPPAPRHPIRAGANAPVAMRNPRSGLDGEQLAYFTDCQGNEQRHETEPSLQRSWIRKCASQVSGDFVRWVQVELLEQLGRNVHALRRLDPLKGGWTTALLHLFDVFFFQHVEQMIWLGI
jgi:hypothetical protein